MFLNDRGEIMQLEITNGILNTEVSLVWKVKIERFHYSLILSMESPDREVPYMHQDWIHITH